MKKLKLYIFNDITFFFTISFFILYYILRANNLSFVLSLFLGAILSGILTFIFTTFLVMSDNKKISLSIDKKDIEKLTNTLCFNSDNKNLQLISKLLNCYNVDNVISKNKIILPNENSYIYPIFQYEYLESTDVIKILKKVNDSKIKIIIYTIAPSTKCLLIIKNLNLNVKIVDVNQFYLNLKKFSLIEKSIQEKTKKPPLKDKLSLIFNKKKAKPFLISGLVIMLSSSLIGYPIFYIVVGSVLMLIGSYLRFFAKSLKNDSQSII